MKRFVCLFVFLVLSLSAFAADNMHIFLKEQGEAITGFKTATLPSEIKITVAYPDKYQEPTSKRFPLVFLFDTKEYKIEDLREMFYGKNTKNPKALVASFRLNNINFSQEQFNVFLEDIFAFFELNYKTETDPSKRIILASDTFALQALNAMQKGGDYFSNLGIFLNNSTSLPSFKEPLKKTSRIFCYADKNNILRLQDLFLQGGLKPLENFFLKINSNSVSYLFDLRYFLNSLPKIKQIRPVLPKELSQETFFYLQVKTNYGLLDFFPTEVKFAPPILTYIVEKGTLQILLKEQERVKISGVFAGKKWSGKTKISD